jgi:single-stranded DNA-binding protein
MNVRAGDGDGAQWVSVLAFDPEAIELADRFVKGARIEGRLSTSEWTGQDGKPRFGLSCMSWHCRLAQIGRNRPHKPRSARSDSEKGNAPSANTFHDDKIPF